MFSGNPGKAALYSLVVPGAGQFYNKKYWKIPVVWAAEGLALAVMINQTRSFNFWDKGLKDIASGEISSFQGRTSAQDVKATRDSRMSERDYSIIFFVAVHLFQVSEAFVNRHLIEFDVSDDLSIQLKENQAYPGFSLSFNF